MENDFLYRGISEEYYKSNGKKLAPKVIQDFEYQFGWDEGYWDEFTWGPSDHNAVIRHQLNQEGFPTSGISTTPRLERAFFYATNGGKDSFGWIFKIDQTVLQEFGVKKYIVSDFSKSPSVPEDEEIILVAQNGGVLPQKIVIDFFKVNGNSKVQYL